ncbi:MAG: hypothetical protein IJR45_02490, partial [Firmicutes bacterium]|nr:hypothetical protein [Bacillota bacterium]
VLTDFNQAGQAGVDINYGGNVKVAGDAVFNMTKQQVSIAGDLIVGGDLTININNSGMSKLNVAGGIYVKGDLIIIGDNACEIITADGIYIKNGNLYNTAGVSVSANYIGNSPSSSDGLAVNLTNYFSNGDETPDFKLYMEISELIDAPFPSDEMMGKPKTKLPESLEDGGSANVITDMPSLIANSTREEIDLGTGTMKHVYKITEDTIFDCNMGVLLGDNENQNYSTVDEDGNAVTYRQKDNIILFYADGNPSSTSNENALDIRFTTNFAWGGGGSETSKGGRIWVDDNNHNGCVRCFIDAGKSNIKVNAGTNDEDGQCWGIEPIMTPVSGDQSDGKQWVPVDFEDGEKYINYNYVPNFYFFSLSTEDAVPSGAVELVPPKNLCVPGYFLTPNLNFNFDPLSSCGFKGSGDTKVTLDNAPAIHGCVNSNNADFQASGVVIVKGYRPGDTDDVGTYNAWPYATAVKNVYGYFDSTTGEYLDISDE